MKDGVPPGIERAAKWILFRSPHTEYVGRCLYRKYLHLYLSYRMFRYCVDDYEAPIERSRLLWVDPTRIVRVNDPGFFVKRDSICKVMGGDWDEGLPAFEDVFPYDSFEAHFLDAVPWEETEMYEWVKRTIRAGRTWGRCETMDAAEDRFKRIDELYHNIKNDGYRTQRELWQNGVDDPFDRDLPPPPERYEIKIDIGRDGELIFEDGRHRLAIAKLLGLDSVPVYVLVRHRKWQERRDSYFHSGGRSDVLHPDLRNLHEPASKSD